VLLAWLPAPMMSFRRSTMVLYRSGEAGKCFAMFGGIARN
jgi:hypothetical protein